MKAQFEALMQRIADASARAAERRAFVDREERQELDALRAECETLGHLFGAPREPRFAWLTEAEARGDTKPLIRQCVVCNKCIDAGEAAAVTGPRFDRLDTGTRLELGARSHDEAPRPADPAAPNCGSGGTP